MFGVSNENVGDGEQIERPGWTRASFPAYQNEGKPVLVDG